MKNMPIIALSIVSLLTVAAYFLLRTDYVKTGEKIETSVGLIDETVLSTSTVNIEEELYPEVIEPIEKESMPVSMPGEPVLPIVAKGCFIGGCSSQICSDEANVMSTCEWKESYACYQSAVCEKQATGQCGWTQTEELNSCIVNAGQVERDLNLIF